MVLLKLPGADGGRACVIIQSLARCGPHYDAAALPMDQPGPEVTVLSQSIQSHDLSCSLKGFWLRGCHMNWLTSVLSLGWMDLPASPGQSVWLSLIRPGGGQSRLLFPTQRWRGVGHKGCRGVNCELKTHLIHQDVLPRLFEMAAVDGHCPPTDPASSLMNWQPLICSCGYSALLGAGVGWAMLREGGVNPHSCVVLLSLSLSQQTRSSSQLGKRFNMNSLHGLKGD